ncbi:lipopolysaccharide heptosyltransferase II [Prosthecobacter fusiformis]|uniref:lipopolysaccharide heptosyltransferase II n=1 Tax=Prosthecobacter fusiformis TaxID=48464 RepID=A0A4R7RZY6_9BACT|nr:lipopolysaccharide heptosyltransferase II [Prosthecobacter fusiformis]TDU70979.1 lipopolysaccharide heptosyltransferase II [Prosthecobacter fusiformis]
MGKASPPKNKTLQLISHWLVYALFRCIEGVLWLLPLALVWYLGRILGSIGFYLAPKYRRLAKHNLRIAFGSQRTEHWIHHTAKAHFQSLFSNILCGFKLPMMKTADVERRVTVEGNEYNHEAMAQNKPILYMVAHLSCWEVITQVPQLFAFGRTPAAVYQPLRNPFLNALLIRRRRLQGFTLFNRQDGFNGPMKHMKEGGCLGILVDQHAGDHGIWCPLFDRLASTTPIAAMMTHRARGVLVPVAIYDDGPGRWRMVFGAPVETGESKQTVEGLTLAMNQRLEKMVRRQPENWFWVHNRWKLPKPRFLLKPYKRGIAFPTDYDPSKLQPFELLVRSPNWLGDACMAFPAVRAMKAGRPDCKITVFGPEKLRELWESQPEVDRYIGKENKEGLFSVARRIKKTGVRIDAAILLTNSTRSTLEFWLAGIPRLVGYKGSLRSRFLTQIIKEPPKTLGPPMHHTLRYLHVAKTCGADIEGWDAILPVNTPPAGSPIRIGICAGAEYGQAKRWPMDRFADVMKQVSAGHPEIEWAFFGAPGEAAMGEQLSQMVGEVKHRNLVGKTRLSGLITELRSCHLLVTNDTGTMHLAAALGVPTVSIFGSTEPVLTGPLGPQHTVIRHHVPCSPCFKRECPFGHYECMTRVTPAQVAAAVEDRLARQN